MLANPLDVATALSAYLRPLSADVFVTALDPAQRVQFEREGGRVVALTLRGPDGPLARFAKPRT